MHVTNPANDMVSGTPDSAGVKSLADYSPSHVPHSAFGSWRGMFLTLGLVNLLVAAWSFVIPDNPASAAFLDVDEREWCTHRLLLANKTAPMAPRFNCRQALRSLQDVAVWLIFLISALYTLSCGAITTFSSTLITGFGHSSKQQSPLYLPYPRRGSTAGYHDLLRYSYLLRPVSLGEPSCPLRTRGQHRLLVYG
ncbi:hypothetical protein OBBRIDRAFT_560379 [Obba rivulosa]|uniref:Uncharacterized protein n=1 Tax=Obba rivulosa TaxID=1052685 RepID=A0A8E2AZE1_9APHY|nr:hypothetical protein OBBRIDRAFT_560379 [Obba rivulosa]